MTATCYSMREQCSSAWTMWSDLTGPHFVPYSIDEEVPSSPTSISCPFVVCDAIIGRSGRARAQKAISNRQSPSPFLPSNLQSTKGVHCQVMEGAPPLSSSIPFETVTHFATGKHLSDALMPPPPERKNGNTLFQSGVTKRPLLLGA